MQSIIDQIVRQTFWILVFTTKHSYYNFSALLNKRTEAVEFQPKHKCSGRSFTISNVRFVFLQQLSTVDLEQQLCHMCVVRLWTNVGGGTSAKYSASFTFIFKIKRSKVRQNIASNGARKFLVHVNQNCRFCCQIFNVYFRGHVKSIQNAQRWVEYRRLK